MHQMGQDELFVMIPFTFVKITWDGPQTIKKQTIRVWARITEMIHDD